MVEPVYKPRNPKISPLYQSIQNHFGEFESVYEERYQKTYGVLRDVVREVVYKYLGCGDLRKGFARIKCKGCNHEVLLAFSCKGRYFCPSCHQKRVLMFGEWITGDILYPLPHRQYVFTVPKILRPYFRFDRKLLGKLSQCAYQCLKEFFRKTLNPVTKKNFAIFTGLDWIATLTAHIPNKGEQLVRYYGYYSNVSRGKRKKGKPAEEHVVSWKPEVLEVAPPPVSKELKKRWSYFIRKVYETDPLTCPKCQGEMRIISFIDQPDVIKKILQHLGLWEESHAPPGKDPPVKEISLDLSYSQVI